MHTDLEFARLAEKSKTKIRIGTSGYSFADWKGNFYPDQIKQTEMLAHYAKHFDTVEVNYTYYRLPTAKSMAGMVNSTPDEFTFFVKAFGDFTHKHDLTKSAEFKDALLPMSDAKKLGGLLFQFPQSFKRTKENRIHLAKTISEFEGFNVAVEFRDNSWHDENVFKSLKERNATLVSVDQPNVSTLFPRAGIVTSSLGYLRFHSRNGENWYAGPKARYDYDYTDAELREWLPLLDAMAKATKTIFLYFNNCHRGAADKNAKAMQGILKQYDDFNN